MSDSKRLPIPQEYLNNDFDFGFTATDDPGGRTEEALNDIDKLHTRLTKLEQCIIPLLINLMKDPEKEHIKWPNRKEQIENFIEKVLKLTRG